jgi:hypothetical protein
MHFNASYDTRTIIHFTTRPAKDQCGARIKPSTAGREGRKGFAKDAKEFKSFLVVLSRSSRHFCVLRVRLFGLSIGDTHDHRHA